MDDRGTHKGFVDQMVQATIKLQQERERYLLEHVAEAARKDIEDIVRYLEDHRARRMVKPSPDRFGRNLSIAITHLEDAVLRLSGPIE